MSDRTVLYTAHCMLREFVILTTCLLATTAAGQKSFYCNSSADGNDTIWDRDFYLVTRIESEPGYPPGLDCEFIAEASENETLFVTVINQDLRTAVYTIESGDEELFRGSRIPVHQSSLFTASSSLRVTFNSTGDSSRSSGVRLRVQVVPPDRCPPGWARLHGNCYGTNGANSSHNFTEAQAACNSMRSNLMQLPENYTGTISSLLDELPRHLRDYRTYYWIGLTDRAQRFQHYWLNGDRQISTWEIGCLFGERHTRCPPNDRCGAVTRQFFPFKAMMSDCSISYKFICSMPPGGSNASYIVPNLSLVDLSTTTGYPPIIWRNSIDMTIIWWSLLGALGLTCLILICVSYVRCYNKHRRRVRDSRTGTVMPAMRLNRLPVHTEAPATVQRQQPRRFQAPPSRQQGRRPRVPTKLPAMDAPPSYEEAIASLRN